MAFTINDVPIGWKLITCFLIYWSLTYVFLHFYEEYRPETPADMQTHQKKKEIKKAMLRVSAMGAAIQAYVWLMLVSHH